MSEPKITYLGTLPGSGAGETVSNRWRPLRIVPWPFWLFVVLPVVITGIYIFGIASPRYVSEAQFVVRSSDRQQPSSLGVALQGVGLSSTQTDAFAVHRYIESRDAVRDVGRGVDLRRAFAGPHIDILSKAPPPWEGSSFEAEYNAIKRYLTVGYDSTTGISVLRVEAFTPEDAQEVAELLLQGGERLINRLNQRAENDAVVLGRIEIQETQARLATAQAALTTFRSRERFIDPETTAALSSRVLTELLTQLAGLKAERQQIAAEAPQSPALPQIDGRIAAVAQQIALEESRVAGGSDALVPKIGAYESLVMERELATRAVAEANARQEAALMEARRQKLYLERVVQPNRADVATRPNRLMTFLIVLSSLLLTYGLGWLVWAGVREHRQH
jgi:capsular polysaccharide transport system permease protein